MDIYIYTHTHTTHTHTHTHMYIHIYIRLLRVLDLFELNPICTNSMQQQQQHALLQHISNTLATH